MVENILFYGVILFVMGVIFYIKRDKIKRFFSKKRDIIVHPHHYTKMVTKGYLLLNNILYHNGDRDALKKSIQSIATQRSDGRYVGGYKKESMEFDFQSFQLDFFYDVVNYVEGRGENFITSLGPNLRQSRLNEVIRDSLGALGKGILLPLESDENGEESMENLYPLYRKVLNKNGIQLAFLDDGSDSYYALLYPLKKELEVKEAVLDIGFDYKDILTDF
jgi:hypothetical protein